MDVLHVIHQFAPETRGGSESYVRDVALAQRARGIDAQVLTGSLQWQPQVAIESLEVDGLPVHRLHRDDLYFDHHAKQWHPGVEALLTDELARRRPRLLHVHQWVRLTSNLVGIAAGLGIPSLVTLHDYSTSCPRAFRRRADADVCTRPLAAASCVDCVPRFGHESRDELAAGIELYAAEARAELQQAAAVLVATAATADLLAATTGLPRERYRVLPFGYAPRFAGLPRLLPPAPSTPFRFAYWGGVGAHKGTAVLLAAFRQLCASGAPAAELHVLGAVDLPAFEAQLRAAAVGLPVTFHGAFGPADLHRVAPHAGVFPSTCLETWGIVLDECFELGRPCVVTGVGALAERAGPAGLVVPAGDAAALATAMRRLVEEPGLWAALAAATSGRLPMPLGQHVDALQAIGAEAVRQPVRAAPDPQLAQRRHRFLHLQRESALQRICPPSGPR